MRLARLACGAAAAALLATIAASAAEGARPAADLIISGAKIWTGDARAPEAQALAVLGERIVAVGDDKDVMAWRGAATRVVQAGGRRLLPGFNDAHVHILDGGQELAAVQLKDVASADEFARRVGERAARTPKGEWVTGGTWDETKWQPVAIPTRQLIDRTAPDVPVAVGRYDGHMLVANSLALKLAGITAATPDPAGGVIVRDASGEPTGALKDAAMELVTRAIPPLTHEQRRAIIERALRHAASLGVTSLQAVSDGDLATDYADLGVLAELREQDRLTARVYAIPNLAGIEDWAKLGLRRAFGDPYLRVGAFKAFADGSLGSRTAYFFEPFDDDPENRGLLSDGDAAAVAGRASACSVPTPLACSCARTPSAMRASPRSSTCTPGSPPKDGLRDRRWRIEHAQHMAAKDFDRFAALGVIASVQPYHAIDDGRWAEGRIGHDRASRTYAFRTFLDHGVRLALGTDWPVAPLDPMLTLYAATTRATLDGKNPGGWFPEQKLTIAEALSAYTRGSAYAEFQDTEKGTLRPGMLADFVLLSADVLAIPPAQIREVKVLKTWVGGRLVYDAAP